MKTNRQLRFRIWDEKRKTYSLMKDLPIQKINFLTVDDTDGYEIEQWTGLKDVNDKNIFEGDIVYFTVFDCFDHDTQYIGVVMYEGSRFELSNPKTNYGDWDNNGPFDLDWVLVNDCEAEIIGNINENPELLK